MYEYTHGGNFIYGNKDKNDDILDFSANINPLGLPFGVYEAIEREIKSCIYYPDSYSRDLRNSISKYENVDFNSIFVSNGASDIIFRLAFSIKPKKALVMAPTFLDYERGLLASNAQVVDYFLYEKDDFKITEDILKTIKGEKFDMIFICNPNNPTGILTNKEMLINILESSQGAYVVVDECFLDFVDNSDDYSMKEFLNKYKNLVILKAFTKIFAMPGMRLGYALSSSFSLIDALYFHGPDWSVSNLAQIAGISALKDSSIYLKDTKAYILKERNKIEKNLKKFGFKVFESSANFIFFKSPYDFNLYEALKKKNIFIRSCGNFKGLTEDFYRIGISKEKNNERLIEAIGKELL